MHIIYAYYDGGKKWMQEFARIFVVAFITCSDNASFALLESDLENVPIANCTMLAFLNDSGKSMLLSQSY